MREVSGRFVASRWCSALLSFPMAFLKGITGPVLQAGAVTIAISTVISAINSTHISPAIAEKLLYIRLAPKKGLAMASRTIVLRLVFPTFQPALHAQWKRNKVLRAETSASGRRGVVISSVDRLRFFNLAWR